MAELKSTMQDLSEAIKTGKIWRHARGGPGDIGRCESVAAELRHKLQRRSVFCDGHFLNRNIRLNSVRKHHPTDEKNSDDGGKAQARARIHST